jgi:hypothetical protein
MRRGVFSKVELRVRSFLYDPLLSQSGIGAEPSVMKWQKGGSTAREGSTQKLKG